MKKFIYFLMAMTPLLCGSCSDDDKLPSLTPSQRGTVVDNEGNTYEWVRLGDLLWTTSNANNGPDVWETEYYAGDVYGYLKVFHNVGFNNRLNQSQVEDYTQNYRPVYGNLMTFDAAKASAPEGWRLPTDEDWQKLERYLGMSGTASKGARGDGQAYRLRENGSGTELAMLPGGGFILQPANGWVSLDLEFEEINGFYWTSTFSDANADEPTAYYRKFYTVSGKIWRECALANNMMSVRWVKDAE